MQLQILKNRFWYMELDLVVLLSKDLITYVQLAFKNIGRTLHDEPNILSALEKQSL